MNANHDLKFRFWRFPVYRDAKKFSREIRGIVDTEFPKCERYMLTAQLLRAAYSIVLNIAEGSDKTSDKEFAHYLATAHGSLNEVVACVDIARDMNYLDDACSERIVAMAYLLGNQLTAFRKKLVGNK